MTLNGVLPTGLIIHGPALVAPFDMVGWLEHQREQELAGTPPHEHTHPQHKWWLGRRRHTAASTQEPDGTQSEGDAR